MARVRSACACVGGTALPKGCGERRTLRHGWRHEAGGLHGVLSSVQLSVWPLSHGKLAFEISRICQHIMLCLQALVLGSKGCALFIPARAGGVLAPYGLELVVCR